MPRKKRPTNSAVRPLSPRAKPRAKAKVKKLAVATPTNFNQAERVRPSRHVREKSRLWIGADLSLHSLALAGLAWDEVLKKYRGPAFVTINWGKDDHYFKRLDRLSKADYIYDLSAQLNLIIDPQQIFIAQEEPWPFGMANRGKGQSQTLKQQAEMSGAFLAGCLRLGFHNIYQIHNTWWRKIVADDLGITIHHTKWGKGIEGKMRPKEWALAGNHGWGGKKWHGQFPNPVPKWPDMILRGGARIPMPENSKAKPVQPDDRYQALPMALWMKNEEQGDNDLT
jgi:hypothetical protein